MFIANVAISDDFVTKEFYGRKVLTKKDVEQATASAVSMCLMKQYRIVVHDANFREMDYAKERYQELSNAHRNSLWKLMI